jgi:polysaccharide deacetylase family protein (PEP-CTERM system associated)
MHLETYTRAIPRDLANGGLVALTVDVEDYFHVSGFEDVISRARWESFESRVERNTDRLLGILAEAGVSATFFVLGWIAERHPTLVRRIQAAGHEIACHSYDHRLVYLRTPETFREDTRRVKEILEDIIGERVIGYRAPSFSITRRSLWALDILAEHGFEYDSSIFPILRDRYGIPGAPRFPHRITLGNGHPVHTDSTGSVDSRDSMGCGKSRASIIEVPPSTVRFLGLTLPLGGGGYLRLFPESLFRRALERIVRVEHQMAVLYVHPWEVDPDQPILPNGSWLSTFRQYVNLHKTEGRLRRLLAVFPSIPIRALLVRLGLVAGGWVPTDSRGLNAPGDLG